MKRLVLAGLGVAGLVVAVLAPAWVHVAGREASDLAAISSYDVRLDVAADGTARVAETVTASASDGAGVVRVFDLDELGPDRHRVPRDVSVERDGVAVPAEARVTDGGRHLVVDIGGSEGPGTHTYRVTYTVDDTLLPDPDGDGARFSWEGVPAGWTQPIEEARFTVTLPGQASGAQCAVGDLDIDCFVSGSGTTVFEVVTARALPPDTPVVLTSDTAVPPPALRGEPRTWPPALEPVLAAPWQVALVGVVALLALGLGPALGARARATSRGSDLEHDPPPGVGPAQAAYVLDERIGQEQLVATLLHAAERGLVTLEVGRGSWTLRQVDGADRRRLDPVTASLAELTGPSGAFTARADDPIAGRALRRWLEARETQVAAWARGEGRVLLGPRGGPWGLLALVSYAAALVLALANPARFSLLAIVPGLLAVGLLALLPGTQTLRTRRGRRLRARAGGFRRMLSSPASKDPVAVTSGRYGRYLPWAVALGCAAPWAARYRAGTGTEPPVPAWLGDYAGVHSGAYVDRALDTLATTVSGAIRADEAARER